MKLVKALGTRAGSDKMNRGITRWSDWATKRQMTFCVGDSKVRHGGEKISLSSAYKMMGSEVTIVIQKQDLDVRIARCM